MRDAADKGRPQHDFMTTKDDSDEDDGGDDDNDDDLFW